MDAAAKQSVGAADELLLHDPQERPVFQIPRMPRPDLEQLVDTALDHGETGRRLAYPFA